MLKFCKNYKCLPKVSVAQIIQISRPNNPNFLPKLLVVKLTKHKVLTQTNLRTEVCTFYVGHPVYGILVCVPFADIYEGAPVICWYAKQL